MISTVAFSEGDAQQTGLGGNLRPGTDTRWLHVIVRGRQIKVLLSTIFKRTAYKSEKSGMKLKSIITFTLLLSMCSGSVFATKGKGKNKDKQLPQGLQMKLDRGGSLPPGWQKKLVKGEILGEPIYSHSVLVIPLDSKGLLTVRVEGKLIQLVEATREIIEIVDLLNQ